MIESRTAKSVKNVKVALFFYFVNLALNFVSRKVFIDHLGAEVLGLNTTATNLLGFLNLAELGIGTAISYALYKPLLEKSHQEINEIVSVQGWMYRKIALIITGGGIVLISFFSRIFAKAELPLWYAYATFFVLLAGSLFGYFFNYRQIVLTADQKEYKITLNIQGFRILKVILQIAAVIYLPNGYVYWLALELLTAFITVFILNKLLKKEYPWLNARPSEGALLKDKYPLIIVKTKQLFFHKIGSFVFTQTTPLIIYAYSTLTLVAIYGNYLLIITGLSMLVTSVFNSLGAGVGNLVAEGNREKIKAVFGQYFSARFWLASVVCFVLYSTAHSFVSLWIGSDYLLEQTPFILLVVYTFFSLTRIYEPFTMAYGLYQDVWSPVIESTLNIGCSVLFGHYWGLSGVISGIIVSQVAIVIIWKPYFLFTQGFHEPVQEFVISYLKYIFLILLSCLGSHYIIHSIYSGSIYSFLSWSKYSFMVLVVYSTISLILFYTTSVGMRGFVKRCVAILSER